MKIAVASGKGGTGKTKVPRSKWRRPIVRFFKWWAMLFIVGGPLMVCPFCGQAGCGGSTLSAGALGAIFAALTFVPRRIARLFKGRVQNGKQAS